MPVYAGSSPTGPDHCKELISALSCSLYDVKNPNRIDHYHTLLFHSHGVAWVMVEGRALTSLHCQPSVCLVPYLGVWDWGEGRAEGMFGAQASEVTEDPLRCSCNQGNVGSF